MLFLMLVAQGIESNPGPGSDSGATGGDVRGRGSSRGRRNGRGGSGRGGRGRGFECEDFLLMSLLRKTDTSHVLPNHVRSLHNNAVLRAG